MHDKHFNSGGTSILNPLTNLSVTCHARLVAEIDIQLEGETPKLSLPVVQCIASWRTPELARSYRESLEFIITSP